jgi:Helix-turn-helix domain
MTKPTIGGGLSSPPGARDFVPQRAIAGRVIRLLLISATARHCDTSKTPMPELANIRHERFAQGVVNGLTGAEAYRRVAGSSNSKIPAAPTPRLRHVLAGQGVHRTEFCRDLDARRHREGLRGRCPYLCRLFARFHNESPYQFLKRLRMDHASRILLARDATVKSMAAALGFEPFHFSRVFKSVHPQWPS